MFVLIVLAFFSGILVTRSEDCLQYDTPEGLIDITSLKGSYWTFPLEGYTGHTLTVTIGGNLAGAEICQGTTETPGPKPMKDEFSSTDGTCYYVGGLDGCQFNDWDANTKTSHLYYPGVQDPDSQIRNVEFKVYCDESVSSNANVDCSSVTSEGNTHLYNCEIKSKHGCPGENPNEIDEYWFFDYLMGVGGIILIVIICLLVLYFALVGPIVWAVRKFKFKHTIEEGNHPVLFFKFLKSGVLLVWEGVLLIGDLSRSCIGKITKKGYNNV